MRQKGLSYRPARLHGNRVLGSLKGVQIRALAGSSGIRDRVQLGTNQRRDEEIMGGERGDYD